MSFLVRSADLCNCNNYRGISRINVGLNILTKIVTDRISKYAFELLNIILLVLNSLVFRNHEECISLYISIREICQRRKFKGQFTYVALLDLKKKPMTLFQFSALLKKSFTLVSVANVLIFISKLYLTSKARDHYLDMLPNEFPIHRGIRQDCPLSPILL